MGISGSGVSIMGREKKGVEKGGDNRHSLQLAKWGGGEVKDSG